MISERKKADMDIDYFDKYLSSLDGIKAGSVTVNEYKDEVEAQFVIKGASDVPSSMVYSLPQDEVSIVLRVPYVSGVTKHDVSSTVSDAMNPDWLWVHKGEGREAYHAEATYESVPPKHILDVMQKLKDGVDALTKMAKENPRDDKAFLEDLVKDYRDDVEGWEPGLPPCRIASYALAKKIHERGYDVKVVDGFFMGGPHFWVEVDLGDEGVYCLDATHMRGTVYFGSKQFFKDEGYYDDSMGETRFYDFDDKEDREAAREAARQISDDPEKDKYAIENPRWKKYALWWNEAKGALVYKGESTDYQREYYFGDLTNPEMRDLFGNLGDLVKYMSKDSVREFGKEVNEKFPDESLEWLRNIFEDVEDSEAVSIHVLAHNIIMSVMSSTSSFYARIFHPDDIMPVDDYVNKYIPYMLTRKMEHVFGSGVTMDDLKDEGYFEYVRNLLKGCQIKFEYKKWFNDDVRGEMIDEVEYRLEAFVDDFKRGNGDWGLLLEEINEGIHDAIFDVYAEWFLDSDLFPPKHKNVWDAVLEGKTVDDLLSDEDEEEEDVTSDVDTRLAVAGANNILKFLNVSDDEIVFTNELVTTPRADFMSYDLAVSEFFIYWALTNKQVDDRMVRVFNKDGDMVDMGDLFDASDYEKVKMVGVTQEVDPVDNKIQDYIVHIGWKDFNDKTYLRLENRPGARPHGVVEHVIDVGSGEANRPVGRGDLNDVVLQRWLSDSKQGETGKKRKAAFLLLSARGEPDKNALYVYRFDRESVKATIPGHEITESYSSNKDIEGELINLHKFGDKLYLILSEENTSAGKHWVRIVRANAKELADEGITPGWKKETWVTSADKNEVPVGSAAFYSLGMTEFAFLYSGAGFGGDMLVSRYSFDSQGLLEHKWTSKTVDHDKSEMEDIIMTAEGIFLTSRSVTKYNDYMIKRGYVDGELEEMYKWGEHFTVDVNDTLAIMETEKRNFQGLFRLSEEEI